MERELHTYKDARVVLTSANPKHNYIFSFRVNRISSMMQFIFPILALAFAAAAAPTDQLKNFELGPDDALVILSNGEKHVIKKTALNAFDASLTNPADISWDGKPPATNDSGALNTTDLFRRGASGSIDLVVPLENQEFLNWDVAMSSVVHAKDAPATVAISAGQSIANGFSAGGGVSLTLVPDFLEVSGKVDTTQTTTATVTGTITFTIPQGKYGAIVSNPRTFRSRGYTWSGTPGSAQADYWQFDSYNNETFQINGGTLAWVQGVVSTCTGDSYPLKMCLGDDFIH